MTAEKYGLVILGAVLIGTGITKDMDEEKLKQYDTELNRIEDKLRNAENVDKDFYITAEL